MEIVTTAGAGTRIRFRFPRSELAEDRTIRYAARTRPAIAGGFQPGRTQVLRETDVGPFMEIQQRVWRPSNGWSTLRGSDLGREAQLALVFGDVSALEDPSRFDEIRRTYPHAHVVSATTAGEICGDEVLDGSVVVTAVRFARTGLRVAEVDVREKACSRAAGEALARALSGPDLRHVFVVSDGLEINGTALAEGIRETLPTSVIVTGGLSADGDRFQRTLVGLDAPPTPGRIVAVGFLGDSIRVGYGSLGGWDPFGPERLITRSSGNVLCELDGENALDLYERYLGAHAKGLPATGLLFPLSLRTTPGETPVVRTILAVDKARRTMTFAGDVPEGARAQLMRANFDRLVEGAIEAARGCRVGLRSTNAELALLVSCVGRKLVLRQRVEEEVEGVREVLGEGAAFAGFYSYGELCPHVASVKCELHNQTMTITTFAEV